MSTVIAAGNIDSLYGISLGNNLDTLKGKKQRQKGVVNIKGIKHQMYVLDGSVYELDPPFDQLLVQVEMDTLTVKGIIAMSKMSIAKCTVQSNEFKTKIEKMHGIAFKEFKHKGDIFYLHEAKEVFMSIGCQNKRNTVLQYQIGSTS
jgi:hypothetical protein